MSYISARIWYDNPVTDTAAPDFPLACIICGFKPEPVFKDGFAPRQPWGATTFTSYGQYGSTVFDDMGRTYLEINVCDDCMRAKARQGLIALAQPVHVPKPEATYSTWTPYDPENPEDELNVLLSLEDVAERLKAKKADIRKTLDRLAEAGD
jgi:hypothetical protein